jgi:hypothetical protein
LRSKHSTPTGLARLFTSCNGLLRRGRTPAAVVIAAAVIVCSIAWLRSVSDQVRRPLMVQPPALVAVASPSASVSLPVSVGAVPTTTGVASGPVTGGPGAPGTTGGAAPVPRTRRATTKPAAGPTSATAKAALTAAYTVQTNWDTGFIGAVRVTNVGAVPQSWTVTVRYDGSAGVRVTQAWNASLSPQGDTAVFSGGPLAPGATADFGFKVTKQVAGPVQPAACTVNHSACELSLTTAGNDRPNAGWPGAGRPAPGGHNWPNGR